MKEWKPSRILDDDDMIDWDTIDIHNPEFDVIRRELSKSIAIFTEIQTRMNTGQSALPTPEMEIKKEMVETALIETRLFAELIDRVLAMRELTSEN